MYFILFCIFEFRGVALEDEMNENDMKGVNLSRLYCSILKLGSRVLSYQGSTVERYKVLMFYCAVWKVFRICLLNEV